MGKRRSGHWCWACDRVRANERFSGKGHARHICRDCQNLGPEELEFRQAWRDLERAIDHRGRVKRRRCKQVERLLVHHDRWIRRAARDLLWGPAWHGVDARPGGRGSSPFPDDPSPPPGVWVDHPDAYLPWLMF